MDQLDLVIDSANTVPQYEIKFKTDEVLSDTWNKTGSIIGIQDKVAELRGVGVAIGNVVTMINENGDGSACVAHVNDDKDMEIRVFHFINNEPAGTAGENRGIFEPELIRTVSEEGGGVERSACRELRFDVVSGLLIDGEGLGLNPIEREDVKLIESWEKRMDNIMQADKTKDGNDPEMLMSAKNDSLGRTVTAMKCYFDKEEIKKVLEKRGIGFEKKG